MQIEVPVLTSKEDKIGRIRLLADCGHGLIVAVQRHALKNLFGYVCRRAFRYRVGKSRGGKRCRWMG